MSEIDEKPRDDAAQKEPGYEEWVREKIKAGLKESREHPEESVTEEELRKELGFDN